MLVSYGVNGVVGAEHIVHKMLHKGQLETIVLVGLDVLDDAVESFEAEQPVTVARTKVQDSFQQVPVKMHVQGNGAFAVQSDTALTELH